MKTLPNHYSNNRHCLPPLNAHNPMLLPLIQPTVYVLFKLFIFLKEPHAVHLKKKTKTKLISTTPDYTPRCLLVQLSSCSNKNNTNNVRIEIATAKQLKHNNKLSPKRTNKLSSTNTNVCTYSKTNKGQQQFATKTMRFQKYAQPNAPTTNPMH
jgi:hypothetical protein